MTFLIDTVRINIIQSINVSKWRLLIFSGGNRQPSQHEYWPNVGFPLAFSCQATLAQYWASIGNIGIGFISAPNNGIILVQYIGNQNWFIICLKVAG